MTLFADEKGEAITPMVLLHGFGGSHEAWMPVRDELHGRIATLAYDLPGHGASVSHLDAGSPRRIASALLADIERRGHDRIHLAGHSMGGAVAALMAISAPERVASLTLMAPGGFGPQINHRLLTRYAAATGAGALAACIEAMTGWYSPVCPRAVARMVAARALPGQTERLVEIARGLAREGRQGTLPRAALEALAMPVHVVWGGLDNVLPVRQAQDLPPRFTVRLFPDLGHMLPEEAPAEMAAIIERVATADDRAQRRRGT